MQWGRSNDKADMEGGGAAAEPMMCCSRSGAEGEEWRWSQRGAAANRCVTRPPASLVVVLCRQSFHACTTMVEWIQQLASCHSCSPLLQGSTPPPPDWACMTPTRAGTLRRTKSSSTSLAHLHFAANLSKLL